MPPQQDRPSNMRALLESTGTPFHVVSYAHRAVIFFQRDACDSVMHIEKGCVRLAVTAPTGKEAIVGLLGTGAFLGEEALGGYAGRRHTATAMTATELLVVAKARMIRVLRSQHEISGRFIAHILTRNARLEGDVCDQILNFTEQRVARALLVLAGCGEQGPCRCALPDVSQEIIAEMVGTTRTRVNVFMRKFKQSGFIEEDGGVLQVNASLLHVIHDRNRGVSNGMPGAVPRASSFETGIGADARKE